MDSQAKHNIIGIIGDKITNILSVFLFSAKQKEYSDLKEHIRSNFIPKQMNLYKYDAILQMTASILYIFKFITVLFVMIYLKKYNLISVGDFAFVFGLMIVLTGDIYQATVFLQDFIKALGDLKASVSNLEERSQAETQNSNGIITGNIEFKNMTFYHNNTSIFDNFNLKIKQGEKIGIIGQSGSGKSTIVYLLLKFISYKQLKYNN